MNISSITTDANGINVNFQESIKRRKTSQYVSKDKKRPLTLTIGHDLIFVHFEVYFFLRNHVTLLCASLNPGLTFRLSS